MDMPDDAYLETRDNGNEEASTAFVADANTDRYTSSSNGNEPIHFYTLRKLRRDVYEDVTTVSRTNNRDRDSIIGCHLAQSIIQKLKQEPIENLLPRELTTSIRIKYTPERMRNVPVVMPEIISFEVKKVGNETVGNVKYRLINNDQNILNKFKSESANNDSEESKKEPSIPIFITQMAPMRRREILKQRQKIFENDNTYCNFIFDPTFDIKHEPQSPEAPTYDQQLYGADYSQNNFNNLPQYPYYPLMYADENKITININEEPIKVYNKNIPKSNDENNFNNLTVLDLKLIVRKWAVPAAFGSAAAAEAAAAAAFGSAAATEAAAAIGPKEADIPASEDSSVELPPEETKGWQAPLTCFNETPTQQAIQQRPTQHYGLRVRKWAAFAAFGSAAAAEAATAIGPKEADIPATEASDAEKTGERSVASVAKLVVYMLENLGKDVDTTTSVLHFLFKKTNSKSDASTTTLKNATANSDNKIPKTTGLLPESNLYEDVEAQKTTPKVDLKETDKVTSVGLKRKRNASPSNTGGTGDSENTPDLKNIKSRRI